MKYAMYMCWYAYEAGLKVNWMTQKIWVIWITSLVGQVGFINKLSYLDVTWISHVLWKQCWHLVSEWTLGQMNALKYHWCKTSLFLSQAVLKHVVSKDFIFKKSVQGTCIVSCQEWKNSFHTKNFHVMLH